MGIIVMQDGALTPTLAPLATPFRILLRSEHHNSKMERIVVAFLIEIFLSLCIGITARYDPDLKLRFAGQPHRQLEEWNPSQDGESTIQQRLLHQRGRNTTHVLLEDYASRYSNVLGKGEFKLSYTWRTLPSAPSWDSDLNAGPIPIDPYSSDWPNSLAMCTMIRNEAPADVLEWVRYHLWLGANKIFIRENSAEVPRGIKEVLKPFVESGAVDLGALPGPMQPLQSWWFSRCGRPDLAGAFSWVLFTDVDEFLVVLEECAPPEIRRRRFKSI
jgi:hypothetical protein